jgi:Yip1 domain
MSDATSLPSSPTRASTKPRHSLHLGRTFRSLMFAPRAGFESAFKIARRRERAGDVPVEGRAPMLFSAVAGMSVMLLWLKFGGLVDVRDASRNDFKWSYLFVSLLLGLLLGIGVQRVWGWLGTRLVGRLRGETSGWQQRLIWGAAAFPQVVTLFVLLPLDLLIVGAGSFTTDRIDETYRTVWAALSISVSLALVAWSLYLFARGMAVATEMDRSRIALVTLIALITVGILFAAPIVGPVLL